MKIQSKNVKGLFVAGLFTLSAVAGMAVTMQSQVSAAGTYTWSGGGMDLKFSTASNWEGGVVPTDGAKLIFPCLQGDSLSLSMT